MTELGKPELGVAAWADLASVRRTVEWVGLDETRLEKSMFTGATVGRLLRRIVERHAPEGDVVTQLEQMTALMDEFDGADLARRSTIIDEMRSLLDVLVPVGELGARRHDLERKAKLSKPSRRDRRGRKGREEESGDREEAQASQADGKQKVDSTTEVETEAAGEAEAAVEQPT